MSQAPPPRRRAGPPPPTGAAGSRRTTRRVGGPGRDRRHAGWAACRGRYGSCQGVPVDIAVIGLGLIGGSLLRALGAGGHAVTGYDTDPATRDAAAAAGNWRIAGSVAEAAEGAEVVVLAV